LRCVISSSETTAWLICASPVLCSPVAAEISPITSVTRRTLATISVMV